ncbi:MAG: hypothetical protein ACI8RD_009635 [Bacillariaceae sp.]|jgi:hypothetical protein
MHYSRRSWQVQQVLEKEVLMSALEDKIKKKMRNNNIPSQ